MHLQVGVEVFAFVCDGFSDIAIEFLDKPVPDAGRLVIDAFETLRQSAGLHGLVLIENDLVILLPQQLLDELVSIRIDVV